MEKYSIFQEGKRYSTAFINEQLEAIFLKHNIRIDRKIMAKDMEFYFEAEEYRTSEERGWKLIRRLIN